MARKATLKTTTAVVAPTVDQPVTHGKNEPDLIPDLVIRQTVDKAFAEMDQAGKLSSSSVQRMSFAVWAQQQHLVHDRPDAKLPKMHELIESQSAKSTLLAEFEVRKLFLGDRPQPTADGQKSDEYANRLSEYNARNKLLDDATKLASVFATHGMTLESYNEKTAMWHVPSRALFGNNFEPTNDELANSVVPLDGKAFGGNGRNKAGTKVWQGWNASVKRVMDTYRLNKTAKPAADNKTAAGQGDTGIAKEQIIGSIRKASDALLANSIADVNSPERFKLLKAIYQVYVLDAGGNGKMSDYTDAERNLLQDLRAGLDAMARADDPSFVGKSTKAA